MPRSKHLHKYKKVNLAREGDYYIYKCIKPECSHYIPVNIALGAKCECSRCGNMMIIGKLQLHGSGGKPMTNPHCANCIKRKVINDTTLEMVKKFVSSKAEEK